VTDGRSLRRAFAESWTYFGRLDAVFANAGVGLSKPVLASSLAEHRTIFDINYLGTVRTLLIANEYFERTPSGLRHFVICSSCLSDLGLPGNAVYAATKAAQKSLAEGLRAEVRSRGMRVTSVHPIGTRTEFFERSAERSGRDKAALNTHSLLLQDPMRIGRGVVRALRHNRPEVWGSMWMRLGLAGLIALPGVKSWALRRAYRGRAERAAQPVPADARLVPADG